MNRQKVRELLAALQDEVQKSGIDEDTRSSLEELDAEIHELLEASGDEAESAFDLDRVKALEARFAASHPRVERFLSEILDTLAKLGF